MARINKDDLTVGVTVKRCSECERVEVVHGSWIHTGPWSDYECSVCHEIFENESRYCPECGAYMGGVK